MYQVRDGCCGLYIHTKPGAHLLRLRSSMEVGLELQWGSPYIFKRAVLPFSIEVLRSFIRGEGIATQAQSIPKGKGKERASCKEQFQPEAKRDTDKNM